MMGIMPCCCPSIAFDVVAPSRYGRNPCQGSIAFPKVFGWACRMRSFFHNLILLMLTVVSVMWAVRANAAPTACLAGKRLSLTQGHFSGPLVCSHRDASFRFVGKTAGTGFFIYDYRYRFLPSGGHVMHGGQRIVFFHGENYAGQYALAVPPYSTVTVDGSHAFIKTLRTGQTVDLSCSRKPPRRILVNGEIDSFFR